MARPKGSLNGTTASAKGAIDECFKMLGGVDALHKWAENNENDFYTKIWPKILPLTVAGDKENPLLNKITVEFISARKDN